MTDTAGPFDGVPWAEAQWARHAAAWAPSGVYGSVAASTTTGDLPLSVSGRSVGLGAGRAWVRGFGFERTGAAVMQAVPANTHGSFSRRDRIVLRRDLAAHTITPVLLTGTPAATPAAPALSQSEAGSWDLPLFSFLVPPNSGTTLTGIVDERRWISPDGGQLEPVTLRRAVRAANHLTVAGGSQAYGSSTAGYLVIPAGATDRLVRVDADVEVFCTTSIATAGIVRLHSNSVELLPAGDSWGTFHNRSGLGNAARPATAHVRWEGRMSADAQNVWLNVTRDPLSDEFWVHGVDLTVTYR